MNEKSYLSPTLEELVPHVTYKQGWVFYIQHELGDDGSGGWHLFIVSHTADSLNPDQTIRVRHGFLIPPATYNRDTWAAWIFNRVRDVETHEAGEFFRINDEREFAPHHGNGEDPYLVWHHGTDEQRKKRAGDD